MKKLRLNRPSDEPHFATHLDTSIGADYVSIAPPMTSLRHRLLRDFGLTCCASLVAIRVCGVSIRRLLVDCAHTGAWHSLRMLGCDRVCVQASCDVSRNALRVAGC